ncbi:MAG: DUF1353 domain-containing protein [Paracoccus sp. (in: a-proteobacteria)]
MSSFTNVLQYSKLKNGLYVTEREFTFYLDDRKTGEHLTVKAGTLFNGASIPKKLSKLFGWNPIDHRWLQATVVHDVLVGELCHPLTTSTGRLLHWVEAADWFDAALRVKRSQYDSCPKLNRILFVHAVKLYGFFK